MKTVNDGFIPTHNVHLSKTEDGRIERTVYVKLTWVWRNFSFYNSFHITRKRNIKICPTLCTRKVFSPKKLSDDLSPFLNSIREKETFGRADRIAQGKSAKQNRIVRSVRLRTDLHSPLLRDDVRELFLRRFTKEIWRTFNAAEMKTPSSVLSAIVQTFINHMPVNTTCMSAHDFWASAADYIGQIGWKSIVLVQNHHSGGLKMFS